LSILFLYFFSIIFSCYQNTKTKAALTIQNGLLPDGKNVIYFFTPAKISRPNESNGLKHHNHKKTQ